MSWELSLSDEVVMDVRADTTELDGCSEEECRACVSLAKTLVSAAAGVIAGAKPAALFTLRPDVAVCPGVARSALCAFSRYLRSRSVEVTGISWVHGRFAVLVWRPDMVGAVLCDPERMAFLRAHGLPVEGPHRLVGEAARRLARYYRSRSETAPKEAPSKAPFPHEIGLILGYPLEDVMGFVEGRKETCRGLWRAYGDADAARERFARLAKQEAQCRHSFERGAAFGALLA